MAIQYKADEPKKSTAVRKDVHTSESGKSLVHKGSEVETGSGVAQQDRAGDYVSLCVSSSLTATAGTQALPVDTNSPHGKTTSVAQSEQPTFLDQSEFTRDPEPVQRATNADKESYKAALLRAVEESAQKPKRGRPSKESFNKAEYNRAYMDAKRKAAKLGISVKQWRKLLRGEFSIGESK